MKKILTLAAAAIMMVFATNAYAQLSVGAGYLRASQSTTRGDVQLNAPSNGAYAGVSYNLPIVSGLSIAPGLYYSFLFSNDSEKILSLQYDSSFREHFANIPVYVNYAFPLGPNASLFLFAGPTVQFGLSSKVTVSADSDSIEIDQFKDRDYSRSNVLIGGGLGLNINRFQISAGYDYGLFNLNTADTGAIYRKTYAKVGVAYLF